MADQPNVFDPPKEENGDSTKTPQTPQGKDYTEFLSSIKNESGVQKYDSVEKALEALKHSQEYIPQMKQQLAEKEAALEEALKQADKTDKLTEMLEKLSAKGSQEEGKPPVPNESLNEQAVVDMIEKIVSQRDSNKVEQTNLNQVQEVLVNHFGEKAGEEVNKKAKELGITPKELETLSKKSPKAVLALFGQSTPNGPKLTTGTLSTQLNPPKQEELTRPEKSLLAGASSKDISDFMNKVKESVYKKYNIEN